jgi:hypothetical protein
MDRAKSRQQASQLLLLAIVDKKAQTIDEVRDCLRSNLARLKTSANKDFYFDLGWLENLDTVLNEFASLNWVQKHHSLLKYQSTKIGRAQIVEQWKHFEEYLGMPLSEFQKLC